MIKIGQKIVYRDEVCELIGIAEKYLNGEDYYELKSTNDASLVIKVPVSKANGVVRPLLTKQEVKSLIRKIPEIPTVPINTWNRGQEYKELMKDGSPECVISIIKTAYLRQQESQKNKHKTNENDKQYFRQAERVFYSEIAATLDMSYSEAKEYIISEVDAISA